MTITFTQSDLDKLKAAWLSNAKEVQIGERRMTFKSQKEIEDTIRIVMASIASQSGVQITAIPATFSKGQK